MEQIVKFPPIGGEDDGIVGQNMNQLWEPMRLEFEKRLPAFNALSNTKRGEVKTYFSREVLNGKWKDWNAVQRDEV